MNKIRNFCIIAHIDHGKSTLADRLLEATATVRDRDMKAQLLDDMDLERERGITIKSHAIQMNYKYQEEAYILNLIDTPGHVDFSYEVSRSIAACEGALLIVDAAQGIEAQTISNLYLALEHDLEIIPILNKIDLASAKPQEVGDEIIDLTGCHADDLILASAKTGQGVETILEAIIERIPPPEGDPQAPLQALIFDCIYNPYRGVEVLFRVKNGTLNRGDAVKFMATNKNYEVEEVGILKLNKSSKASIAAGDVGYLISGVKVATEVKVGDTITGVERPCSEAIKGFEDVKPMVFAGIYPIDSGDFEALRLAMEKLQLNDAALVWQNETSDALGYGFRCGFLGMLHLEIVQERLEREFKISVLTTVPSVQYKVLTIQDETVWVKSPSELPNAGKIQHIEEPFVKIAIITKDTYIGNVIKLCIEKRGILDNQIYLSKSRVELSFKIPLGEIAFDFFDKLKTISKGYASLDYEFIGFRISKLVKLNILLNNQPVDAFSAIIHRDKAYYVGKAICEKLKKILPRQQFEIPIQAAINTKVIARETVKALRKNVTAKCYGGDITRKRKLLEKQKKGKKRMRQFGNVAIPQEAFASVFATD